MSPEAQAQRYNNQPNRYVKAKLTNKSQPANNSFMNKRGPGRPGIYLSKIIALKPKKSVYLAGAEMASIKAIASRAGSVLGRKFRNRTEDGGVIVERTI